MISQSQPAKTLQLVHSLELDVNIFDTDCYGVMWHGAYTKWLEMGRVKLLESRGYQFPQPGTPNSYVFPVVEQNLKFKKSAPYGEKLILTTRLALDGYKLRFLQEVKNRNTDHITLNAETTVVVVDENWKLQRRFPPSILALLGTTELNAEQE